MVDLNITVDLHGQDRNLQRKASELDKKMADFRDDILVMARHKVKTKAPRITGRLQADVQTEDIGGGGAIFVAKIKAPYADYVIDGHLTRPSKKRATNTYMGKSAGTIRGQRWVKGNPFVDAAVPEIEAQIDRYVSNFIKWLED